MEKVVAELLDCSHDGQEKIMNPTHPFLSGRRLRPGYPPYKKVYNEPSPGATPICR